MAKSERLRHAREVAKQFQQQEQKRQLHNKIFLQSGIGGVILIILVVIILVIVNSSNGTSTLPSSATPKNMINGGIYFQGTNGKVKPVLSSKSLSTNTSKPVTTQPATIATKLVTYIDWSCSACKQFELTYTAQIVKLVAQGKVTLDVHPIAILDRSYQSSRYSSRAANAAACIANYVPTKFLAAQTQFFANQPAEGSTGLTNTEIKKLISNAGINNPQVNSCVDHESFKKWVTATTKKAISNPSLVNPGQQGFGTPTVLVNNKIWNGSTNLLSLLNQK